VGWDLFEFVIIYLFFVETKGRTNPAKASVQKQVLVKEIISHGSEPAQLKFTEAV